MRNNNLTDSNSKLYQLLSTFTKSEFHSFIDYISSPYFNKENVLIKYITILEKYFPELPKGKAESIVIFSELYPAKKYNASMMRKIISKLLQHAENFSAQMLFDSIPAEKEIYKLKAICRKGNDKLFKRALKKTEMTIDGLKQRNSTYFYNRMQIEDEYRNFIHTSNSIVFPKDDNIERIADNVIYFMSNELLRLYAVMINRNKHLIESNFEMRFLDQLLKFYRENPDFFRDIHYAHLYYNSIMLFLTEEEKYFFNVHKIALEHYDSLPDVDRKNAYVVLVNYTSEMINKGKLEFMKLKFDLYKEIIDKKAHYEGLKHISHVFYSRVCFAAINLNKLDWASDFMEKFKPELEFSHREHTYRIALTEYLLKTKNYEKAVKVLSMVKGKDPLYKEEIYILLLKIYYSAGYYDSFISVAETYNSYLKSNKMVSERRKKLGLNFIKLIKELNKITYEPKYNSKEEMEILRKKIIENSYLPDKFWLLEKLNNLPEQSNY